MELNIIFMMLNSKYILMNILCNIFCFCFFRISKSSLNRYTFMFFYKSIFLYLVWYARKKVSFLRKTTVNFDMAISREKRRDVEFFAVKYNKKKTSSSGKMVWTWQRERCILASSLLICINFTLVIKDNNYVIIYEQSLLYC